MWEEIAEVAFEVCTEWEVGFIENVESAARSESLSPRQLEILTRIHGKCSRSRF
jgi:hypothetical protein